jgi:exopolysaccharide biosynthesis polyprenyl glycosylphosphotransferase
MLQVETENPKTQLNTPTIPGTVKAPNSVAPIILVADILGLVVSLVLASYLTLSYIQMGFYLTLCVITMVVLAGLYLLDTYHPDRQIAGMRAGYRVFVSNCITGIICILAVYLSKTWEQNLSINPTTFLIGLGLSTIWSIKIRLLTAQWLRSHAENYPWLMLGAGDKSMKVAETFLQSKQCGKLVVLTEDSFQSTAIKPPLIDGGDLSNLMSCAQQHWSGVIVGDDIELSDAVHEILMKLRLQGTPVYRLPDFCEFLFWKIPPSLLEDHWFAFSGGFNLVSGSIRLRTKRVVDLLLSAILLLMLSPLMAIVGLLIKLDSRGPIFYSQLRSGLHGETFRVYKFRSMYKDAEKRGAQWAKKRDPRVTRIGYWLRILRIDELPQIWNVLRGEMSLIGPRPERPEFDVKLKEAIPYYELRYLVKPGITGWAQVLYPYGASFEDAYEKLSYDLYYIKNYSLWLDFAIILKTIRVVFLGKGR